MPKYHHQNPQPKKALNPTPKPKLSSILVSSYLASGISVIGVLYVGFKPDTENYRMDKI